MRNAFQPHKVPGARAQAMVEFALVLMILLVVLVGILEVGRMMFIYAAVNNASREAARYGSAIGLEDSGVYLKYQYCQGIKDMAQRSAFFTPLTTTIKYDHGPGTSAFAFCDIFPAKTSISVNYGTDRVYVEVSADYDPMINLLPISHHTFASTSARTILDFVDLDSTSSGSGPTLTSAPTLTAGPGTVLPSNTPTGTPTGTITPTPTKTQPVVVATFTPLPSSTPTIIPSSTSTATNTPTATSTVTPTGTATPSLSCSTITAGAISVTNNTNVISMTITNPYIDVTVSSITLVWPNNGANVSGNPKTLTLDSANLGTTFWSGLNNSSGTVTLTPASTLTLPGNNTQSTIKFTFLQTYKAQSLSGTTTITINLSTPGCTAITKTAQ